MSEFWRRWLVLWCWTVMLFGLVLAGAGLEATSGPARLAFAILGPGHPLPPVLDPTLRFSIGLMGAVTIGWGATMLATVIAGNGTPRLWRAITVGLVAWFVIDSTLSVATGFPLNAVSNTVLLVFYLIAMRGIGAFGRSAG